MDLGCDVLEGAGPRPVLLPAPVIDLFSRKIVGWEVWEIESGDCAATLVDRAVLSERCRMILRILHCDNGAIQKSSTLLVKIDVLGVLPSINRPGVSNENAYIEYLFRTCKYRPDFPTRGFASIETARQWVQAFLYWHNHIHRHSALRFVTPAARHAGLDGELLTERRRVYGQVRDANPARWSGAIRNWNPVGAVHLNSSKDEELIIIIPQ